MEWLFFPACVSLWNIWWNRWMDSIINQVWYPFLQQKRFVNSNNFSLVIRNIENQFPAPLAKATMVFNKFDLAGNSLLNSSFLFSGWRSLSGIFIHTPIVSHTILTFSHKAVFECEHTHATSAEAAPRPYPIPVCIINLPGRPDQATQRHPQT